MSFRFCYIFFLLIISSTAFSQSPYVPYNQDYYHLLDRLETKYGRHTKGFHLGVKTVGRKEIVQFTDSLLVDEGTDLSEVDLENIQYLRNDSWEYANDKESDSDKPLWDTFYKKKSVGFYYQNEDVDIQINPILQLGIGYQQNGSNSTLWQNTRGIEIRGMLGKKVGFYTNLTENQVLVADYVRNYVDFYNQNDPNRANFELNRPAYPGEGFVKYFKKDPFTMDFFTARGYISFNPIKSINLQFGHDKTFIGDGFRSLMLSENAAPSLFLKATVNLGRLQYTNLWTEYQAPGFELKVNSELFAKKYAAMHHLSVNLGKSTNIGFYEAVIFNRTTGFELNYLNPIIFYRFVEGMLGSADNALLGLNFRTNIAKSISVYGQLMIDEFNTSDLFNGKGSWNSKLGYQLGVKYFDVLGVRNLDLQVEGNVVRPYAYSHFNVFSNYTQYNQPLAHPLGSNFEELVGVIRWQPTQKLNVVATAVFYNYGADRPNENWGGNLNLSYNSRARLALFNDNNGNFIGQGRSVVTSFLNLRVSYMLKHNLFVDLSGTYRKYDSALASLDKNVAIASMALRWNLPNRLFAY